MLPPVLYLLTIMTPAAAFTAQAPMLLEACLTDEARIIETLPPPAIARCIPVGKQPRVTQEATI